MCLFCAEVLGNKIAISNQLRVLKVILKMTATIEKAKSNTARF